MYNHLYNFISKACCVITVYSEDEKISEGSGFCVFPTGEIITAAHVVTGRMPIRSEDVTDHKVRIFAKFANHPLIEYQVKLCAVTIKVGGFSEDVQIDIAVLVPKEQKENWFLDVFCGFDIYKYQIHRKRSRGIMS